MAYVLTDGSTTVVTYPYSIGLLRGDNPTVSFPASPSDTLLAEWNVFPVTEVARPSIDTLTEYLTEGTPIFVTDHWEQVWVVNTYTVIEQASVLAQFQTDAAATAASLFEASNKYITQSLTEGLELSPELIAYRTALSDPASLPGYPNNIIWPTEPTQYFIGAGATKIVAIEVENVIVSGSMTLGSTPVTANSVVTKEYVDDSIASLVDSSPATLNTLNELAAALGDDANFATTVSNQIALKANSADVYTKSEVYTKTETNTAIAAATTGLALRDKVLNLQAPVSPSTTPVIAPALATIGTTNGYTLNLSFGNFDEVGPIVFNEKWQLQVDGPPSATTTAVTIKNGITIQNSNGVRLTRVQIEGTSSISSRAGLGLHFEKVQFMGPLTLGGTGGFMMFTDCELGGNVTISPTFAGVIYFFRCSFSDASATYTFGQTSSQQVIVMDSSGVPNTGFVSGATPKASYSGMITYKNLSQAHFINNIPVSTAGATSGQVLKYNGVAFAPAADSATDATKLPLSGGTMSGAIAMGNNKVTGLGAPTVDADAATKAYVDTKTANVFTNSGGTIYGDLVVQDMDYTFEVNPSLGTFYMVDGTGSNVEGGPGFLSVVDSATGNSSALLQGGTISLFADVNANTVATPTEPQHVTTKEYVDNLVAGVGGGGNTTVVDNWLELVDNDLGSPVYPSAGSFTGTTRQVSDQASLVSAIAASATGDIVELTADITLTSTLIINKAVKITGPFTIQSAGTGTDPVTLISVTAAAYIDSTVTVWHKKTTNTSVETAIAANAIGFISAATVKFMEFGYVLRGSFNISGSTIYTGALGNNHRHIAIYNLALPSVIQNVEFDFPQETTARSNFILVSSNNATTERFESILKVSGCYHDVNKYCRQFFMMEALNITNRNASLWFDNNTFNDLSGGIGFYNVNATPLTFDSFTAIVAYNNKQGTAGDTSYKGFVYVDGTGAVRDIGTPSILAIDNNHTPQVLRSDYSWAVNGVVSYKNTSFSANVRPTVTYGINTDVERFISWKTIFSSSNTAGAKTLNNSVSWNLIKNTYKEVMFVGVTSGNTVSSLIVPSEMIVANYAYSTPRNDLDYVVFNGMTNLANGSFTTTFNGNVIDTIIYAR